MPLDQNTEVSAPVEEQAQNQESSLQVLLNGVKFSKPKFDLVDGSLNGFSDIAHQGKIGGFKVTIEGNMSFLPLVNGAVDWLEEKIPGDQKAIAQVLKDAIAKIKL